MIKNKKTILKQISIVLLIIIQAALFAQERPGTFVFNINTEDMKVNIEPIDSILWLDEVNRIKIKVNGDAKFFCADLKGGKITRSGDIHKVTVTEGTTALLSVYVKDIDDSVRIATTKPYKIMKRPDPQALVCGVRSDSVLEKTELLDVAMLFAVQREPKQLIHEVKSFRLIWFNKTTKTLDTLATNGFVLTLEMRRAIQRAEQGDVLFFDKIFYTSEQGVLKELDPVRIFLIDTPRFRENYERK